MCVCVCFRISVYPASCGLALVTNSHAGAAGSGDVCPNTHQHAVHHKERQYGETSSCGLNHSEREIEGEREMSFGAERVMQALRNTAL